MQQHLKLIFLLVLLGIFPGAAAWATEDTSPAAPVAPPPAPSPAALIADEEIKETVVTTGMIGNAKKPEKLIPLLWQEKDIPPLCFDQMMMVNETVQTKVSIPLCNDDAEKKILRTYIEDGWVRTDYRYKADGDDYPALTSMYRVIGKTKDGYAIEMSSATGGSGRFTTVIVVKVDGPILELLHNYGVG